MNSVRKSRILVFIGMLSLMYAGGAYGQQDSEHTMKVPPAIGTFRAEEDYSYLQSRDKSPHASFLGEGLKYIPIHAAGTVYMRLGGQFRTRWDHYTNNGWTEETDQYYSQRISVHASVHAGSHFRLFGELYHGFTSSEDRLFQDDEIDTHQLFLEWVPHERAGHSLSIRAGRQELSLGISRLVGIRDGPNIRRAFDMGRIYYQQDNGFSVNALYGEEVNPRFDAFDNVSHLFEEEGNRNPRIWSLYLQGLSPWLVGVLDAYYIGFHAEASAFNDVVGKETRHSIGVRSSSRPGKHFSYNTELIYQFGRLSGNTIRAYNVETDWKYSFDDAFWKLKAGVKLDWSSGDRKAGDGTVHTFNPLFVNPGIYSLAGVNTPANLTSFHPNVTLYPAKDLVVYLEYALFYRTQDTDGFYAPPRFQTRPADGINSKHLGDVVGLRVSWTINRNTSFTLLSSYFLAGGFIKASGPSNNIFYISPTLSFSI